MNTSDHLWDGFTVGHPSSAAQASREQIEHRLEQQALVSRALWELLKKHAGLEERDLVAKVAEIDLRDGSLDHRLKSPLLDCPNCGNKVNARRRFCAYCGFKDFPTDVFERL
jgi:hypothetical protein